ncbi:MAG: DUF1836 domain-containing protein [Lachnospiraceae bacterium]|nr:DUF1836 domain-containing protein [Lachnospiraceae bacterium]
MSYDKELVQGKLKRWENYILHYRLPLWEELPDFGLYMEQVTSLLSQVLNYLPNEIAKEDKSEMFPITSAAINNYVRTKTMPEPVKKRYYRVHIAYLIMICTMKQTLSISLIKTLIPVGISEDEVKRLYTRFIEWFHLEVQYFGEQLKQLAGPLYAEKKEGAPSGEQTITASSIPFEFAGLAAETTEDLIFSMVLISVFSRLLAQKLLLLHGRTLNDSENIELRYPEE